MDVKDEQQRRPVAYCRSALNLFYSHLAENVILSYAVDRFRKRGRSVMWVLAEVTQQVCETCMLQLGGSGGMPPQENLAF